MISKKKLTQKLSIWVLSRSLWKKKEENHYVKGRLLLCRQALKNPTSLYFSSFPLRLFSLFLAFSPPLSSSSIRSGTFSLLQRCWESGGKKGGLKNRLPARSPRRKMCVGEVEIALERIRSWNILVVAFKDRGTKVCFCTVHLIRREGGCCFQGKKRREKKVGEELLKHILNSAKYLWARENFVCTVQNRVNFRPSAQMLLPSESAFVHCTFWEGGERP